MPGAARRFFDAAPLVLNGDAYLPIEYRNFVATHRQSAAQGGALGSMTLFPTPKSGSSGHVIMEEGGRISAFAEKKQEGKPGDLANAGAYVLES